MTIDGFDPTGKAYTVTLPDGTSKAPIIVALPQHPDATVQSTTKGSLPGTRTTTLSIRVPSDGADDVTITLTADRILSSDANLTDLTVDGQTVDNFNASTTWKLTTSKGLHGTVGT